jgi:RNA recognition motif-containing protein
MEGTSAPEGRFVRTGRPSEQRALIMGNRLYVGNLPFSATEETLRAAFASSGQVTDVHIVTDRESGQSRGFAFVTMGNAHEAATAMGAMNGASLEGRALRVNEAEERTQRSGGGGGGGGGGRGGGGGGGRNKW